MMITKFRKSPPVCLFLSLIRLLTGRLRFVKQYKGHPIQMEDGQEFTFLGTLLLTLNGTKELPQRLLSGSSSLAYHTMQTDLHL